MHLTFHNYSFYFPGRPSPVRTVSARFGRRVSAATFSFLLCVLIAPAFLFACTAAASIPDEETAPYIYITKSAPYSGGSLDIFFFDDTPLHRLDSYTRVDTLSGNRITCASLNRSARVVLLSNVADSPYRWSDIDSYASLSQLSLHLDDETCSAPAWSAEASLEAGWSRACVLSPRTSLSRVRLHLLSCDFTDRPAGSVTVENVKAYLTRACTECLPLCGDKSITWANPGMADSVAMQSMKHPEYLFRTLDGPVDSTPRECNLDFYTYPNPNTGMNGTRLVLECDLQGRRCYYPLPLSALKGGVSYELDVHITREGTTDPDTPAESAAVVCQMAVLPWEPYPEQRVTF